MDARRKKHSAYFKFVSALEKIIEWISAIAFFGIFFVTILQVVFRYIVNSPLLWSEELARYLGIFVILLASSVALRQGAHIGIDVFSSKLPKRVQHYLKMFYSVVVMGVMGYLSYYNLQLVMKAFSTPSPAMRIPMGIPYTEEFGKSTSDDSNDKVTSVTLLGMEEAEALMNTLYSECIDETASFTGFDSAALKELITGIQNRTK